MKTNSAIQKRKNLFLSFLKTHGGDCGGISIILAFILAFISTFSS